MTGKGLAIHCHHDNLIEHCYSYRKRVDYIKKYKPSEEVKTRLRLFKMIPLKAISDLPDTLQGAFFKLQEADSKWQEADSKWREAHSKYQEADSKRQEVYSKWQEAESNWQEAHSKWREAYSNWQEAESEWLEKDKADWHRKWCGCEEWDGKELRFKKAADKMRLKFRLPDAILLTCLIAMVLWTFFGHFGYR